MGEEAGKQERRRRRGERVGQVKCVVNEMKGAFLTKAVVANAHPLCSTSPSPNPQSPPQGTKSCPRSGRLFTVPTNPRILNTDSRTSPHRTLFVWGWSRSRLWAEAIFFFFFCSLQAVMSSATASRHFRVPLKHTQPHTQSSNYSREDVGAAICIVMP